MEEMVAEKMQMLYDFCILKPQKNHLPDPRQEAVRAMLEQCESERKMEVLLHDVLLGRETIGALLQRKGLM